MILLLLRQEPHDLRGILCHTLRVSDVKKVADFEVSSKRLHSLFSSLLHQFSYLLDPILREWGSVLLSQTWDNHLDIIDWVQVIVLEHHLTEGHLFTLGSS